MATPNLPDDDRLAAKIAAYNRLISEEADRDQRLVWVVVEIDDNADITLVTTDLDRAIAQAKAFIKHFTSDEPLVTEYDDGDLLLIGVPDHTERAYIERHVIDPADDEGDAA